MKRAKCPKCGSTALYVPCTVTAQYDYNADNVIAYNIHRDNIDCQFLERVTCKKCGNVCSESEWLK